MIAPSTATAKTAKASTLPSASNSPDSVGERLLARLQALRTIAVVAPCLLGCLLDCSNTKAMAAEIVARADGAIFTERDVANRSLLVHKRLARLLPALRLNKGDRQAFALDLLLQEALQRRHLIEERALPVTEAAVKKRMLRLNANARGGARARGAGGGGVTTRRRCFGRRLHDTS